MLIKTILESQIKKRSTINVKKTKNNIKIIYALLKSGLIFSFQTLDNGLIIHLKYSNNEPIIKKGYAISSSSRRLFIKRSQLKKLQNEFPQSSYIVNTSKGLEVFKFKKHGGLLIQKLN